MFIRKVHADFPDEILKHYIYDFLKEEELELWYKMKTDDFIEVIYKSLGFLIVYFLLKLFSKM